METFNAPPPTSAQQRLRDAAEIVLTHLSEPGRQSRADAAHALDRVLGPWLDHYFLRKGVRETEAEELTFTVWTKLLAGKHVAHSNAFALVCRTAHSVLADHVKKKEAQKNRANGERDGVPAETFMSDELEDWIQNSISGQHVDLELRDCVQKMWRLFVDKHPTRAELIEYRWEGLSYLEIAILLFGEIAEKDSKTYVARVRNRIEEARKQAKPLFKECRD